METPMLVTRNFDMMPLRQKDAGVMFSRWMTDKEVAKYMPWQPHKDADETHRMVEAEIQRNQSDSYFSWGMFFDDFSHGGNRPRLFGVINLTVNKDLRLGTIEFCLMRSEWGNGYAAEAATAVLNYAFGDLDLRVVNAACHTDNKPAARVLERVGFQKQYDFTSPWKTGGRVPMVRYQVTYEQYCSDDEDDEPADEE